MPNDDCEKLYVFIVYTPNYLPVVRVSWFSCYDDDSAASHVLQYNPLDFVCEVNDKKKNTHTLARARARRTTAWEALNCECFGLDGSITKYYSKRENETTIYVCVYTYIYVFRLTIRRFSVSMFANKTKLRWEINKTSSKLFSQHPRVKRLSNEWNNKKPNSYVGRTRSGEYNILSNSRTMRCNVSILRLSLWNKNSKTISSNNYYCHCLNGTKKDCHFFSGNYIIYIYIKNANKKRNTYIDFCFNSYCKSVMQRGTQPPPCRDRTDG